MSREYFEMGYYNGTTDTIENLARSTDFNVEVIQFGGETHKYRLSPPKRITSEQLPGVSGDRKFEEVFETKQIELTCALIDNSDQQQIADFLSWISRPGIRTLKISSTSWRTYLNVSQVNEIDLDNYGRGSIFKLSFVVHNPYSFSEFKASDAGTFRYDENDRFDSGIRWDTSGIYSWTSGDLPNLDIYHGGTSDVARPVFTIVGSGSDIAISKYSDSARTQLEGTLEYGAFNGTLVIDSRKRNVFLNSTVDNSAFQSTFKDGDYMKLDGRRVFGLDRRGQLVSGGNNTFEVTLDSSASSVDDFYNGDTFYVQGNSRESYISTEILDYNGTTKVATIRNTIKVDVSGCEYSIYKRGDGMNYISITGTGLNITSIDVDFRFTYY